MATKNGTKVLTEILNIEGIKVRSQSQQPGIGIMLQVDSISKESHCHFQRDKKSEITSKPSIRSKRFIMGRKTSIFRNQQTTV